jgi:alkylhydroperoxidase family enzyme
MGRSRLLFRDRPRRALRLTEAVTSVSDGHVSDEDYNAAAAALTPDQISVVTWLATV